MASEFQRIQPLSATAPAELNKLNKSCLTAVQSFTLATSGFPKSVQGKSAANLLVKRGGQAYTELHAGAACPETHSCNTVSAGLLSSLHTGPPSILGSLQDEAHHLNMWNPFLQKTTFKIHHTANSRLDSNVLYNSVCLGDKHKLQF